MTTYRTFKRSGTSWEQFANARKITEERGLSYAEALDRCKEFNDNRSPAQIRKGTMLEFTVE
jgi:hypothetical protein